MRPWNLLSAAHARAADTEETHAMKSELQTPFRDSALFEPYKRVAFVGEYVWWNLRGRPRPKVPHLVKQRTLTEFAQRFDLKVLVEGGTNLGNMINVQKHRFREIYSVERDDYLAARARRKFAAYPHIHLYHGDSGVVLPQIVPDIREPALFWLDAHWGAESAPIRIELKAVYAHPVPGHVMLIDDARYFDGHGDYPSVQEMQVQAADQWPGSVVDVKDDIIRIYRPKY
jgi:hypothetical protein